jgi:DNA-directed RNA polymerase specialized sigma24 family protein
LGNANPPQERSKKKVAFPPGSPTIELIGYLPTARSHMTRTASPILHLIRRVAEDRRLKDLPDQELLRSFLMKQDKAAFDALLRRHGAMVLDVCRSVLRNEQDVEDAFQATFLVLAQKGGSIRKTSSLGSWLYGVAYRTAINSLTLSAKRRKHEARSPNRMADLPGLAGSEAGPARRIEPPARTPPGAARALLPRRQIAG